MKKLIKYIKIIGVEAQKFPNKFSKFEMLSYFFRWKSTLSSANDPLNNEIPWVNFPTIDFLKKIVHSNMKVYEYGSGSSTFFWAKCSKEVVSVEHDEQWVKLVRDNLSKYHINNVSLSFIPPEKDEKFIRNDIENPSDYSSDDKLFKGYHFKKYAQSINQFPDNYFDIVIVDGRARPSCLIDSRGKVKPGGYLLIDNTERDYYLKQTLPILEKEHWKQIDFYGPVPGLTHFCKTTIFLKSAK